MGSVGAIKTSMYHPRYNDFIFYGIIVSFLTGIALRSFFVIPVWFYFVMIVGALGVLLLPAKTRPKNIIISIFIFLFCLGMLRFDIKDQRQPKDILDNEIGSKVVLEGWIVSEPEYKNTYQRFVVKSLEHSSKVLISADRYPEYYFGDRIVVEGTIYKPENFITDTGREFDYVNYLAKDEIYYTMSYADVSLIASKDKGGLRRGLFVLKRKFLESVNRVVPEPESALLGGILLGVKQNLGNDLEQAFIDTGTIHIVVLSGYNVTIVSEAIVRSLQQILPKQAALSFGGMGIILFALITGATTTTVRASVMGLLGLLARVTNRTYEITRALFLAAFIMVVQNPYVLIFDISFQLSFIATLGLIIISPRIEAWRFSQKLPKKFGIREIFASTIATQIAVFPYLLYKIGTLSIISPLANMLVLPVIPISMGVGFVAGLLEYVTHIGSNPLAWLSYGLLHYTVSVVEFLSSFSWSSLQIHQFHWVFIVPFYIGIGVWIYRKKSVPVKTNR